MDRRMKLKSRILILLLPAVMILCFTGCSASPKVGIYSLGINAATGNRENNNCISLVNHSGSSKLSQYHDYSLMSSDTALKLIDEIRSLPDVLGNEKDPFAYEIILCFYDDNGEQIYVNKTGYGAFPDNWSLIVSYTNEISDGRAGLTDSTDIVVVDADLLRREFGLTDDMLPEGVTLEQYIEDTGLTYSDLYYYNYNPENSIRQYGYGYYNLVSHRIFEDTVASPSSPDALLEYAQENLGSINSYDDISVTGTFEGYAFEIVRFDQFDQWRSDNEVDGFMIAPDDTVNIFYYIDLGCEGMTYQEEHYVYADPSHRFLIITRCDDYEVINRYYN